MKLALLGDLHFGMRNDRPAFHEYYRKFYHNVFFPYLEKHRIRNIVQVGDVFDRRKFINFNTLHLARKDFFDYANAKNISIDTLVGNHDTYFKNTLDVNSLYLLIGSYLNVKIHLSPSTMDYDGLLCDFIPWICEGNKHEAMGFMARSKSPICFGHFQLRGYEMERGSVCMEGISDTALAHYTRVYSGHFHHRSASPVSNIEYIGSPGEMTWGDYDDERGFTILDTKTLKTEFIQNPYKMHVKVQFDGAVETKESVLGRDYSEYTDKILKVSVDNKKDDPLFEQFIKRIEKANPLELQVIESFVDKSEEVMTIDEADDTPTLINKYVDAVDMSLDKDVLKGMIREIYRKALDAKNVKEVQDASDF